MKSAEELFNILAKTTIPPYMHESIVLYIIDGRPVGHFLTAIIDNDLKEACARADTYNQKIIFDYVYFFYNFCPSGCWGSAGKCAAWMAHHKEKRLHAEGRT